MQLPYNPAFCCFGIYTNEMKTHVHTHKNPVWLFMVDSFAVSPNWDQLSTWMPNKLRFGCSLATPVNGKELLIHGTTWVISHSAKCKQVLEATYQILPYIGHTCRTRGAKNRSMVGCGNCVHYKEALRIGVWVKNFVMNMLVITQL